MVSFAFTGLDSDGDSSLSTGHAIYGPINWPVTSEEYREIERLFKSKVSGAANSDNFRLMGMTLLYE